MPNYANILSTGSYLPEIEVTNDALRARFNGSAPEFVDKMEAASGIRSRWQAPADWAASDLALRAAQQALDRAGLAASDIDLIILGTDSPDYITPATSVVLQSKLGATNAGTFDVGCACASFPTAIASASGLMTTNPALRRVLVVGVYMMRKLADDGSYHKNWLIPAGGTAEPTNESSFKDRRTAVKMFERYPPEINNEGWPRLVRQVAANGGFDVADIDFVIFTQVRKPTIELVMVDLRLPIKKTHTIMETMGYTGSACIPMALDDAIAGKKIKPGDLVVMVGSGVGYNQAAAAFRMPLFIPSGSASPARPWVDRERCAGRSPSPAPER